jgi:hypothetical protein
MDEDTQIMDYILAGPAPFSPNDWKVITLAREVTIQFLGDRLLSEL